MKSFEYDFQDLTINPPDLEKFLQPLFVPLDQSQEPFWFADKNFSKNVKILERKPGLYTIWSESTLSPIESKYKNQTILHRNGPYRFIYVGISMNLQQRLSKHRNGSRGGNIFAVYAGDRYILEEFQANISPIINGTAKMDSYIGSLVQRYFGFRFIDFKEPNETDKKLLHKWLANIEDRIKNDEFKDLFNHPLLELNSSDKGKRE